ncbi:MAG TPA: hypothetical protein VGZ23_17145 [bacterium]|nr:hypothetical protein [bacterium]
MTRRYQSARVEVGFAEDRRAGWDWLRKSVTGHEFIYGVLDRNFDRLNSWTFIVQVPKDGLTPVIVRPRDVPPRRTWAAMDRKSIAFMRATKHPYRGRLYCKVSLADPTGRRTKSVVNKWGRRDLPKWINRSGLTIRVKDTVTTTKGTDGNHLVFVVKPDDHVQMIRIFFATKVWVLQEGFRF